MSDEHGRQPVLVACPQCAKPVEGFVEGPNHPAHPKVWISCSCGALGHVEPPAELPPEPVELAPLALPMVEHIELANEAELIEPFLKQVEAALLNELQGVLAAERLEDLIDTVRADVAEMVKNNGFCNYGFHRTEPEFMPDGRCAFCEKDVIEHDRVLVCPRDFVDGNGEPIP